MKKLFSIILCGVILLSNIATVFAEEVNNIENEISIAEPEQALQFTPKQEEAISAFRALGFVTEDYTEEIIIEMGNVTRAKFVEFAAKVYSHMPESDNLYYHDVPRTHYAFSSISAFVENSVLSVGGEKLFRPDDYITPNEASKILVYLLGYNQICEASKDPMSMVKQIANDIDLYDGVNSGYNAMSFADMVLMVYNSVTVVLPHIYPLTNSNNDTYLSKYYDVYLDKGRVTGAGATSLYGASIHKDGAMIGDELMNCGNLDLLPYLGKTVKYFYSYTDEKTILWVSNLDREKEIIITRENTPEYSKETNTITYYVNERKKMANLSDSATIIYNGALLSQDADVLLNDNPSYMRLISDGSNTYEICIVESYENGLVVSNNISRNELYVRYYDSTFNEFRYKLVDLSAFDIQEIVLPDGTKGEQKDIPSNSIVSVYESADGTSKIRIVCSVSKIKGIIEDYNNDEEYQKIIIDGIEYSVYKKEMTFDFLPGSNAEFKLDAYGYIADVDMLSGTVRFAYFMKGNVSTEDPSGDRLSLKLFDVSSGEVKRILCAKKVRIDGQSYKDPYAAENALAFTHFGTAPQLIAYTMNDEEQVNMIDTPALMTQSTILTKDNMLILTNDFENLIYNYRTNTFGPKIRVGGSTTFLSVPSSPSANSSEEDFGVGTLSYFSNESYYNVATYQYGDEERKEFADILLCNSCRFYNEYWVSTRFLVDKVKLGMNENNDVVYKVSGYHGNVYKTLFCSEEVTEGIKNGSRRLTKGDVISITNETGKIDDFTICYGPSAIKRPTSAFTMNLGRQTCFYPVDIVGTTIFGGINAKDEFEEIFTSTGATIFVYNSEEDELYEGSLGDLHTYKVYRDNCSTVFYYAVSGEVRNFIIYN